MGCELGWGSGDGGDGGGGDGDGGENLVVVWLLMSSSWSLVFLGVTNAFTGTGTCSDTFPNLYGSSRTNSDESIILAGAWQCHP